MATDQKNIDYLLGQIARAGDVRARKMFGEYALYCNEKVVALVCDNNLYVKISQVSSNFLDSSHEAPPYPGAKNYLMVPEEKWDDHEWLTDFIKQTASVLPLPKPKKLKKGRPKKLLK